MQKKFLNRRQIRKLIINEVRKLIKEESDMDKAISRSKGNKDKVYYYDSKSNMVQVLQNGVIEDTITDVEPGSREYKSYAGARGGRSFGFDMSTFAAR